MLIGVIRGKFYSVSICAICGLCGILWCIMKSPTTIIFVIFTCAVFFFLGLFAFTKFYQLVLPGATGVTYHMELEKLWDMKMLFGLAIALVPLGLFLTWEWVAIDSPDKKLSVVFIVVLCMALVVYTRRMALVSYFDELVQSKQTTSSVAYPFEQLYFEYYLMAGLAVGCVLSYFIFGTRTVTRWRLPGDN